MDIIDEAQERIEATLTHALRTRKKLTIPFSGFCLSCGEPVHERRYCDSACREHYEASMIHRRRSSNF